MILLQRYEKKSESTLFFHIFFYLCACLVSLTTDGDAGISTRSSSRTALGLRRLGLLHTTVLRLDSFVLRLLGCLHVLGIDVGETVERVFLLWVAEDILTEGLEFLFDTLLLGREFRGVTVAELQERLALGVVGLIDLTTIHIEREEIVHRHGGGIVEVRRHDGLTRQVGFQVAVLHPEEGVLRGLTTEVIVARHHWAESHDLHVEGGIGLIIIGTFLEVVLCNLGRGDVTVIDLQLTILFLIEDMAVVEQSLHLHLRLFLEHVSTIVGDGVLIDGYVAILCQFEDVGKEVHLLSFGHHRIIKTCILVFRQINLTVDVTTPYHVLWHINSRRERDLSTDGHGRRRVLCLLLLLFYILLAPALLGLSHCRTSHQYYQYYEQNSFHIIYKL